MKLLDVNILLYAINEDAPLHSQAKSWVEKTFSGTEPVGLSWSVILAFLRLTTRRGLFRNPLSVETALEITNGWLQYPDVMVISPGPAHLGILTRLLRSVGTAGNLTSDAHLAALAIEHAAELCSCDNDFGRFAGLQYRNPLPPARTLD